MDPIFKADYNGVRMGLKLGAHILVGPSTPPCEFWRSVSVQRVRQQLWQEFADLAAGVGFLK